MSRQHINIGAAPNDGNGDTLRDAFDKVNDNFFEVYSGVSGASNPTNVVFLTGNQNINGEKRFFGFLSVDQMGKLGAELGGVEFIDLSAASLYADGDELSINWGNFLLSNTLNYQLGHTYDEDENVTMKYRDRILSGTWGAQKFYINGSPDASQVYPAWDNHTTLTLSLPTNAQSGKRYKTLMADMVVTPTFNNAESLSVADFRMTSTFNSSGTISAPMVGCFSEVGHDGTGTASYLAGYNVDCYNYNGGRAVSVEGGYFEVGNWSNGIVGIANPINTWINNNSNGVISGAYGIYVYRPDNGGTIGRNYGILVEDHSAVATGANVNIESRGANSLNNFEGHLTVGSGNYINFGSSTGSGGYGIRDRAGIIQVKNSGSNWNNVGNTIYVNGVTKTDTFGPYTTGSAVWTDVPGLSFTRAPASISNNMLVRAIVSIGCGASNSAAIRLLRGATPIGVADTAGSRVSAASMAFKGVATVTESIVVEVHDSPATTGSTTWKVQLCIPTAAGTAYVNRSVTDTDSVQFARTVSTLTVMEYVP